MNLQECIKKIDRYLSKDNVQPLIVDVQNQKDRSDLLTYYDAGSTKLMKASDYCEFDELPRLYDMSYDLETKSGVSFVVELTSFLKLQGEQELKKALKELLDMNTTGHVIVVSFQCRKQLNFKDPRIQSRIAIIDGDEWDIPDIILTAFDLPLSEKITTIKGIHKFAESVESTYEEKIYINTDKKKDNFPYALYRLTGLSKAYDALMQKDSRTSELSENIGTDDQWKYALELVEKQQSWVNAIDAEIGSHLSLEVYAPGFSAMGANKRWLYYIGLKLFGAKNNWCLHDAACRSSTLGDLITKIYRGILDKNPDDRDFWDYYERRKILLNQIGNPSAELTAYCKVVAGKGKGTIYYLTDNSQQEKEAIFAFLDQYGHEYKPEHLIGILQKVYPDLYAYMQPYRFKNGLLDKYFQDYKYQKITNKLFPEFEAIVLEQAKKREYNLILEPRSSKIEKLNTKDAFLYFIDAMGVEYLGYIVSICKELELNVEITVCRCELPSITSQNKEFLESWDKDKIVSVKDIDEIKHHGKFDYNYYSNSKLPLHLMKELEIIYDTLEKIRNKLIEEPKRSVIMISDHGASRLAVLHDTENIWEMAEKGQHAGRCCPKSDVDVQPDYATDAEDFWALANYDRFRGSRKANVEVHGGATLEEICVPIIEITYKKSCVEAYLMSVDAEAVNFSKNLEIEVSFRKKAALKIFITEALSDVSVMIDGKSYEAVPLKNKFYRVDMPDICKPGNYIVDIYSGDNPISEGLRLGVKREGQREKDII